MNGIKQNHPFRLLKPSVFIKTISVKTMFVKTPKNYKRLDNSVSKFRRDDGKIGDFLRWRTKELFVETYGTKVIPNIVPMYSLSDFSVEWTGHYEAGLMKEPIVLPSLKNIYLSYDHLPYYEYQFAVDCLGGWEHWLKIASYSWFRDEINKWRLEKAISIRNDAMKKLIQIVNDNENSPLALQAAKFLASRSHETAPKKVETSKTAKNSDKASLSRDMFDIDSDLRKLKLIK